MRRPSSEVVGRIVGHLRMAWRLGRPMRRWERVLSILFAPFMGALLIVGTMLQAVMSDGDRMGYSSVARTPVAVAVEVGLGLPPVPAMEVSRHFRIVPREEAEALIRLDLEGDRLVATVETVPGHSSRKDSRNSLQTAIEFGDALRERTNYASLVAVNAIKSLWREDAIAGSSSQRWTWTNSTVPKRASAAGTSTEAPAPKGSSETRSSETLVAIAAKSTAGFTAVLVYLGIVAGVGIVVNFMSERSNGRIEAYLSTDVGAGDILLGYVVRPLCLAATGIVLACGILLVVQWHFELSFSKAILLATAQSLIYAPAGIVSMIATIPVVFLLASRRWHPALLPVVYGGAILFLAQYLLLPVLAARSDGLSASLSSGGIVGSVLAPVIRSLGPYASELAFLPLAGAVGALVDGWQGLLPFTVSLASGAIVVAYAYRLVLRRGRTWFLTGT